MSCVAVVSIPQGMCSKSFGILEISDNSEHEKKFRGNPKQNFPLQVGINSSGEMQLVSQIPATVFWPKLIDIASDCHDQNVKLCQCPINPDKFVLQTVREIPEGHPLQLWFSDDLMITVLGIPPYLSPINIKGENCYVCTECREEFERPNHLKVHLALHCDRLSSDAIWTRLKRSKSSPLHLVPPFNFINTSPSTAIKPSYPLLSLSPTLTSSSSSTLFRPHSLSPHYPHLHNIRQLTTPNHFNNNNKVPSSGPASTISTVSSSTPSPIIGVEAPVEAREMQGTSEAEGSTTTTTNGRNSLVIQEQHHHHARLEAIVSNMGKAKNGHVCLYCGKLYSRKYGLKIHIRTHTGYKPLRCKICHRPFGDPSNLNKHVRLHSDGSTPYRCELCRKVLVRRRDLDRHMRTRHNSESHHNGNGHGSSSRSNGNSNGSPIPIPEGLVLGHSPIPQSNLVSHCSSSTVTSSMISSSSRM